MAVTATVPYGGTMIVGVTFTVTGAYVKEAPGADTTLVYQVEVKLPDGTIQTGVGWDNVNAAAQVTVPSPLSQAEDHMKARLAAGGAVTIVEV